jgi:hypothetical protein
MNRALAGEHFIEAQYQPGLGVWWEFNWNPIRNKGTVIGSTPGCSMMTCGITSHSRPL